MRNIAIPLFILLAGCATIDSSKRVNDPAAIKAAREQIVYVLKDPSSAQWREEQVFTVTETQNGTTRTGTVVCGQFNSRNSYGGLTGFTQYVVGKAPDRKYTILTGSVAVAKCQALGYSV